MATRSTRPHRRGCTNTSCLPFEGSVGELHHRHCHIHAGSDQPVGGVARTCRARRASARVSLYQSFAPEAPKFSCEISFSSAQISRKLRRILRLKLKPRCKSTPKFCSIARLDAAKRSNCPQISRKCCPQFYCALKQPHISRFFLRNRPLPMCPNLEKNIAKLWASRTASLQLPVSVHQGL